MIGMCQPNIEDLVKPEMATEWTKARVKNIRDLAPTLIN